MVIRVKEYDRFLPARRHPVRPAFSTVLAFAVGGPDFLNFNVINSFYCVLYLSLVGLLIHFERVSTLDICEMHPLLGD